MVGEADARILLQRAATDRDDLPCLLAVAVDRRAASRAEMTELLRARFEGGKAFLPRRDTELVGVHDHVGHVRRTRSRTALAAVALVHETGLARDLVSDPPAQ